MDFLSEEVQDGEDVWVVWRTVGEGESLSVLSWGSDYGVPEVGKVYSAGDDSPIGGVAGLDPDEEIVAILTPKQARIINICHKLRELLGVSDHFADLATSLAADCIAIGMQVRNRDLAKESEKQV